MKKFYMILAAVAAMTMSAQAQDVRFGTVEVGDFENATEFFEGSYWDCAPTTFYLAHTGAQMIYSVNELADIQGVPCVEINKLTFKQFNESAYDEITRDVKIYMQEIEENEFAIVDGVKQFFELGDLVSEYEVTYDMMESYSDDMVLEFPINNPFTLHAGKNLLITMVFDAQDDDNCTGTRFDAVFYTAGCGKAMQYTDNWTSFLDYQNFPDATAMDGCGTNIELPVTLIDYTYETTSGIEEVKANTVKDDAYYNLMGQKFNAGNLPAGIYIHNGQKVVIK